MPGSAFSTLLWTKQPRPWHRLTTDTDAWRSTPLIYCTCANAGKYYEELVAVLQQPDVAQHSSRTTGSPSKACRDTAVSAHAKHCNSTVIASSHLAPDRVECAERAAPSLCQKSSTDHSGGGQHQRGHGQKQNNGRSMSRFAEESRLAALRPDKPSDASCRTRQATAAARLSNVGHPSEPPATATRLYSDCTTDAPVRLRQAASAEAPSSHTVAALASALGTTSNSCTAKAYAGPGQTASAARLPKRLAACSDSLTPQSLLAGVAADLSSTGGTADAFAHASSLNGCTAQHSLGGGQGWLSQEGRTRAQRHAMMLIETECSGRKSSWMSPHEVMP